MSVHPIAAGGFASAASTYARVRPTYARAAVGAVADLARHRDGPAPLVDVGAGTGILTGQLARLRLDCTAVEPLAPMARQLRLALPTTAVVHATAEALPFAADSFRVYAAAQSFHWFDAAAALEEAARVLGPGGDLALLWNVRDDSVPWVAELTDLVERRTGGRPYEDHRERPWAEVVGASGHFTDLVEQRFPNPVVTDRDGVFDRLRSTSFVAALDAADRDDLLAEAAGLLDAQHGLGDRFEYPHHTVLHLCRAR
ncbi:MAG: class I SAM-dependent methyltransferase [Microthrixaceae bacterium]